MALRRRMRPLGHRLFRYKRSSRPSADTSRDTEGAHLGSQKNPVHVLSRDTPVGWAVIQQVVDEYDREQIEAVKNDIDTLLVFIGLFSAVLSAFVDIAVALLQEDIPAATLTTLRQMSAQNANYTVQGDFIHSTSPAPLSFTQFEPTANAIRINNLWNASLVISLATASFGILVKQWLREYTKFVTSFPQGRLRIRKFRRSGLETWKVLTIAACLPLLLQLALGLFFLGLCYYTAELHSSVRNTTLPLVAGWAFIFLFVTASPLFSAHCPYKTPALDSLVVAIRSMLRTARIAFWKNLLQRVANVHWNWNSSFRGRIARVVYGWISQHFDRLIIPSQPYDEVTAANHEAGDLEIMADADELQGNDEIVGTAMVEALQQSKAPPQDIIRFLLEILQHRIQWEGDFESEPQVIDCSMATPRALDSIELILHQHLPLSGALSLPVEASQSRRIACWTAGLYLSVGMRHGAEKLSPHLRTAFSENPQPFVEVALSTPSAAVLKLLLHLTCRGCQETKSDLAQCLTRITAVIEPYFWKLHLTDFFESDHQYAPWRKVLNGESLGDTVLFFTNLLYDNTLTPGGEWSDAQHNVLSLVIKLIAVQPQGFSVSIPTIWRITALSKSDVVVQKLLTSLIKFYPDSLPYYLHYGEFGTDVELLSRFKAAIESILADRSSRLSKPSVLQVCKHFAEALWNVKSEIKGTALVEGWRGIFAALSQLVLASPMLENEVNEAAKKVYWCSVWLSGVDAPSEYPDRNDNEKYLMWRMTFQADESPIPDGFYLILMDLSTRGMRHWRVRRLKEMTPAAREAAAKDIEPYLRIHNTNNFNDSAASPSMQQHEGAWVDIATPRGDVLRPAEEGLDNRNSLEALAGGHQVDANVDLVSRDR